MIRWLTLFIISFPCLAFIPTKSLTPLQFIKVEYLYNKHKDQLRKLDEISEKNKFLDDYKNLVSSDFDIPQYFYGATNFWFHIYSQYSRRQFVIHDKTNFNIIYAEIDVSFIDQIDTDDFVRANIQRYIGIQVIKDIKSNILNKKDNLIKKFKNADEKIPKTKTFRNEYFIIKANNMRIQTGQRDKIKAGLVRSKPYRDFIYNQLNNFEIPKELFAKTFVESTFNPIAYSTVGAAGLWQLMPRIGRAFLRVTKNRDDRLSPFLSTIGALHLIKQNFQIMKRWDLAITAYNSGTKHLINARKKLNKKRPTLEEVFKIYDSDYHGFASRNFYASFLALIHIIPYEKELFSEVINIKPQHSFDNSKINFYVTKVSFRPKTISNLLGKGNNFYILNTHLRKKSQVYPKGTIIVSDVKLTASKYRLISNHRVRRKYPKNW